MCIGFKFVQPAAEMCTLGAGCTLNFEHWIHILTYHWMQKSRIVCQNYARFLIMWYIGVHNPSITGRKMELFRTLQKDFCNVSDADV